MSLGWSSRPVPLSGSLLVIDTSFTVGDASHTSLTVTVTCTLRSAWSGGHRMSGETAMLRAGGVVSTTVTVCVPVVVLPLWSVAVQMTGVEPNGRIGGALLLTMRLGS